MLLLRSLAVCTICLVGGIAAAQNLSSGDDDSSIADDDSYFSLRRSKDRARQLAADRYLNLVKLQEWTDATGKFRTKAKYIDHDPDLSWVKLEATRGRGAERVVKQIQVPVAKLSKRCQSRVRQIARLQPKMDELVAAEAADQEQEDAESLKSDPGERDVEGLAGAERMSEFAGEGAAESASVGPEIAPFEPPAASPVDPQMMSREMLMAGITAPDSSVDRTLWRTNYEAFRLNLSVIPGPGGTAQLDWGELHELRALSDSLASLSTATPGGHETGDASQRIADLAGAVGEVTWEAPYLGSSAGLLVTKPMFALAPIAPPASIQFLLADPQHIQHWAKLQPGQMVRFHGKLKMMTPHSVVVWIRMSDETAAEVGAQTVDAAPTPSRPGAHLPNGPGPSPEYHR